MSWGERGCKGCPNEEAKKQCNDGTCNVSCKWYEWNGKTTPDSLPAYERQLFGTPLQIKARLTVQNYIKSCSWGYLISP